MAGQLDGRFEAGRVVLTPSDAWGHYVAPCMFLALGAAFVFLPEGADRVGTTLAGIGFATFGAWFLRRQYRRLDARSLRVEVAPEILRRCLCTMARERGWVPAPNQDPRRCDFTAPSGDYKYGQDVRILQLPDEVQFNSISSLLPGPDAANMELIEAVVHAVNAQAHAPGEDLPA